MGATVVLAFSTTSGNSGRLRDFVFIGALVAVGFSMRLTMRTYRRVSAMEFQPAHALRWGALVLAIAKNAVMGSLAVALAALVLGTLLTGKIPVG